MGGGKRKYRALTPAQIEWAYEKWCLGYTQTQIAEALEVSSRTILREFEKLGRPRIRPKLIYGGKIMKGVVVTTQNELYVKDFAQPLYETIGKEVGGWIEVVHPVGLKRAPSNLCFVCNKEGLLRNLPLNLFGSVLYGFHIHGNPVVGNIVFMREGMVNGEPDFVELTDADIEWIKKLAHEVSDGEIREVEAG